MPLYHGMGALSLCEVVRLLEFHLSGGELAHFFVPDTARLWICDGCIQTEVSCNFPYVRKSLRSYESHKL